MPIPTPYGLQPVPTSMSLSCTHDLHLRTARSGNLPSSALRDPAPADEDPRCSGFITDRAINGLFPLDSSLASDRPRCQTSGTRGSFITWTNRIDLPGTTWTFRLWMLRSCCSPAGRPGCPCNHNPSCREALCLLPSTSVMVGTPALGTRELTRENPQA